MIDPLQCPRSFLLNTRDSVNRIEQAKFFFCVLDERINQQRIRFGVDVFDHHLKSVEATGLWKLDLSHEATSQVFQHNAVASRKEGLGGKLIRMGRKYEKWEESEGKNSENWKNFEDKNRRRSAAITKTRVDEKTNQDVRYEHLFVFVKTGPILQVCLQIDLFCCPE